MAPESIGVLVDVGRAWLADILPVCTDLSTGYNLGTVPIYLITIWLQELELKPDFS
jgi:hypothetical protein